MKCEHCGVAFKPRRSWSKYCSKKCGNSARVKAFRAKVKKETK